MESFLSSLVVFWVHVRINSASLYPFSTDVVIQDEAFCMVQSEFDCISTCKEVLLEFM